MADETTPTPYDPPRLMGGYKCWVNPADIVMVEVWQVAIHWQVMATLRVIDRDGMPMHRPLSRPFDTEADADVALLSFGRGDPADHNYPLMPPPETGPRL